MTRLYKKSELSFSLVLIGAYVLLFSLSDAASETLGIPKAVTAAVGLFYTFFLFLFIRKNNLSKKYGLCKPEKITAADIVFFIVVLSANLWNGVELNLNVTETVLYIVSMLSVGYIEEVVFRGFLFKALQKDGIKIAVAVSSLTFGMGHIVNLLSGENILATLMQVCYATAIGFAFTVFFLKRASIIPCIVVHSLFNSLSAFSKQADADMQIVSAALLTAVPVIYGIFLIRKSDKILDN